MKKISFAIAALLVTGSASAASINWGFGGNTWVANKGETSSVLAANFTGKTEGAYIALVYIGQNVSALSDKILEEVKASDVVAQTPYAMGSTAKTASTWQMAANTSPATISANDYSVGATFAVLFNNGSAWDYFYGVNTTTGAIGEAFKNNVVTLTDVSANAQAVSIFGTRKSGSNVAGAVVVPEPGTAALALLGIGMLLKRRRA